MGKIVRCLECGEVYRTLDRLEDLRDNDGICLVCNAPIEVQDWDRVLTSYEDDEFEDVEETEEQEWRGDEEEEDPGSDDDFDDFEDDDVDNY